MIETKREYISPVKTVFLEHFDHLSTITLCQYDYYKRVKREFINKSVKRMSKAEETLFFYWLRKLQLDFYNKEMGMPIDTEEVMKELKKSR